MDREHKAFLDMIAHCELGSYNLEHPESDNGYRVLVGSNPARPIFFGSYVRHPLIGCPLYIRDGLWSTAAGRYQILDNWWPHYSRMLKLEDFSPRSQDEYALQQCWEQGAIRYLEQNMIEQAIISVNNIWASLPGSPYNQNPKSMSTAVGLYHHYLNKLEN